MAKANRRRQYKLTNAVTRVEDDVRAILAKRQATRYFEAIILMYSLIENVLKWLAFVKIAWDKSERLIPQREWESLKQFCNQQDFHGALNLALVTGLIKHRLFRQIDQVRGERNNLVHQCYLFTHRRNSRVPRAKLERLVRIADELFKIFNALVVETGADDSYSIFTVRKSRQLLI